MSRLRYRRRRWAGLIRSGVTPVLALVGAGLLLFAITQHSPQVGTRLAADALCCFAAALAWRWRRAPEAGLPDALRLRQRSRVLALRSASALGIGAAVAIAVAAAAHGADAHGALMAALGTHPARPDTRSA